MQLLTGKQYIQVDIANQFGLDKLSWNDRIAWAETHESNLEDYADKAKCPVLFRKAIRAHRDAQQGKPTGFIMGLDATASGLQILAALAGCKRTAERVNLIGPDDREDVYLWVANEMSKLTGVTLDKETVKPAIMTVFYGSTRQPEMVFGKDTKELEAFYNVLFTAMPGAMFLMRIMQASWRSTALQHGWVMPDGHFVIVPVMRKVDEIINVPEAGIDFTFRTDQNLPKRRGLSLAANITHSVDAYIVREMIRRANFELATIHDSFWASPNNMNAVRQLYIDILAEIADSNLFKLIIEQILGDTTNFQKMSTDLSEDIRRSDYSIC